MAALQAADDKHLNKLQLAIQQLRQEFVQHCGGRVVSAQDVAQYDNLLADVAQVRGFCRSLAAVAPAWDGECAVGCQGCQLCKDSNIVAAADDAAA